MPFGGVSITAQSGHGDPSVTGRQQQRMLMYRISTKRERASTCTYFQLTTGNLTRGLWESVLRAQQILFGYRKIEVSVRGLDIARMVICNAVADAQSAMHDPSVHRFFSMYLVVVIMIGNARLSFTASRRVFLVQLCRSLRANSSPMDPHRGYSATHMILSLSADINILLLAYSLDVCN